MKNKLSPYYRQIWVSNNKFTYYFQDIFIGHPDKCVWSVTAVMAINSKLNLNLLILSLLLLFSTTRRKFVLHHCFEFQGAAALDKIGALFWKAKRKTEHFGTLMKRSFGTSFILEKHHTNMHIFFLDAVLYTKDGHGTLCHMWWFYQTYAHYELCNQCKYILLQNLNDTN